MTITAQDDREHPASTRWLLSGHNPQETYGIPYPMSVDYIVEFMGRREMEYVIGALTGSMDPIDRSIPLMLAVRGRLYSNVNYFTRNIALAVPFDPTSIGAPAGLLAAEKSPRLITQLLLPFRFLRLYRRMMRAYRETIPLYRKTLRGIYWRLRGCDAEYLTEQDLEWIDRLFRPTIMEQVTVYLDALVVVGLTNIPVLKLVNDRAPELLGLLVGQGTSTARLGDRMWALGETAGLCGDAVIGLLKQGVTEMDQYRAIPAAAPFVDAVEEFLHVYGHRAFDHASEFEATRLIDQPELVLLTVGGLLEEQESTAGRAQVARQASYLALQRMNPVRRFFWRQILQWGKMLIERREENRDTLELNAAAYGLAAKLLSRHHFPDQPADHLWLYTFDEFLAFGQSHGQQRVDMNEIQRRRAELEAHRQQPAAPELIWYDPHTREWWPVQVDSEAHEQSVSATAQSGERLQGIGVSAGGGPVEGTALVTNSAQEAAERLLSATGAMVLVTRVTDPVWSSMFRRLTAVVTEMGGAISHAAIVARENGIPAVVGVHEATRRICDGQRVRVDGTAGTVEVLQ